uniref:Uncharacterized protein n=1 Tax=Rhizophora mucronata TaxID=61149 RepID=A0A2P2QRK8_RHIMU
MKFHMHPCHDHFPFSVIILTIKKIKRQYKHMKGRSYCSIVKTTKIITLP